MDEADVAALEARLLQLEAEVPALRRLADEAAITRVLLTYTRGQDRGAGDVIASIYHPDALDHHGTFVGLGTDFGAFSEERIPHVGRFFTMHLLGDALFAWDESGDVVHTETCIRATHGVTHGDQEVLELWFGRYLDRFERRAGVWKIAERVVMHDYKCDVPVSPTMPERRFQGTKSREDASFAHLRLERLDLHAP